MFSAVGEDLAALDFLFVALISAVDEDTLLHGKDSLGDDDDDAFVGEEIAFLLLAAVAVVVLALGEVAAATTLFPLC